MKAVGSDCSKAPLLLSSSLTPADLCGRARRTTAIAASTVSSCVVLSAVASLLFSVLVAPTLTLSARFDLLWEDAAAAASSESESSESSSPGKL